MKKALLTAVLLTATNFAWASGLSLDNVEQHMGTNDYVSFDNSRPEIVVQGAIDQFDAIIPGRDQYIVDTDQLKQSYDGQS